MRSKGFRRRTRSLLRRRRGKGSRGLSKILREYRLGDRVVVKLDPSVHKGMPHRRFQGRIGIIEKRRGQAYVVNVTQGSARTRELIVRPEHLEPFKA